MSSTLTLLCTLFHFLYVAMGVGTPGGQLYPWVYSMKLGSSCATFHLASWQMAGVMPLWAHRGFGGGSTAFYIALTAAVSFVPYDIFWVLID